MGVDLFDALGFCLQDSTGAHIHLVDSDIKAQYPTLFDGFSECLGYWHDPRVDPSIAPKAQALRASRFQFGKKFQQNFIVLKQTVSLRK